MTWHADVELLESYSRLQLQGSALMSVESHLTACAECRARLSSAMPDAGLERVWTQVERRITEPSTIREALLEKSPLTRLILASPTLRSSWLLANAFAVTFAGAAATTGSRGELIFLLVAPLLPVVGTALAYGSLDPTHEIVVAAPIPAYRVLLVRALAVLATSIAITAVLTSLIPGLDVTATGWLLPSLTLTSVVLAATTVLAPEVAAAGVSCAWVAVVMLVPAFVQAPLAANATTASYFVAAAAAGAWFRARRGRLDTELRRVPVRRVR